MIERDTETGACYVTFTDHAVARTVHVDDLVMVDLDAADEPVGIEFAAGRPEVGADLPQVLDSCAQFLAEWRDTVAAQADPAIRDMLTSEIL